MLVRVGTVQHVANLSFFHGGAVCTFAYMLIVENTPARLSFVEDMTPFRIMSNGPFIFLLRTTRGSILLAETYAPGPDILYADIDVRDVLRDIFQPERPWERPSVMVMDGYPADIGYMIGDTPEHSGHFSIVPGGIGAGKDAVEFLRCHWLTHQPQVKEVCPLQPEWLSVYYAGNTGGSIVVRFYPSEATGIEDVVIAEGLENGKCYCADVSPQRVWAMSGSTRHGLYDVFVLDSDGTRLTYIQRYVICRDRADDRIFVCVNSLGGWDTFRLSGSREYAPETDYDVVSGSDGLDCGYADTERTFIQRSGPLTENMQRWMMDLLESRRIYAWSDGVFKQMVITESSVNIISSDTVKSVEFSYMYSDGSGLSATERDMTELPALPIADPGDILLIRIVDAAGSPISTVELPSSGDIRRVVVDSKGKWSLK